MKPRPIILQDAMVRAVLQGRKTQLRRVIKPQPKVADWQDIQRMHGLTPEGKPHGNWREFRVVGPDWPDTEDDSIFCPYGQPGDLFWVREQWMDYCPIWDGNWCGHGSKKTAQLEHGVYYAAGGPHRQPVPDYPPRHWKAALHMPRWASRLTLEITEIRVERLQDITEEDAKATGIGEKDTVTVSSCTTPTYREAFSIWWDNQHTYKGWKYKVHTGSSTWNNNPWVWAITFHLT